MLNFKLSFSLITILFLSIISYGQEKSKNVDAWWVISKSIEAMGGEPLLRSIKTLKTEMATQMEGNPVTWVTKEMLPNKGAFQIIYDKRVVYEDWFNGQKGFETVNGEIKEIERASLADKFPRKNIFNELDYLDTSVYRIQLLNDEMVNNIDCYKISAVFIGGFERHLYIDKNSFQTIKEDRIVKGETEAKSSTYFSDFKKFGNLVFYTNLTMGDGPEAQTATITKLLINKQVSDDDFDK